MNRRDFIFGTAATALAGCASRSAAPGAPSRPGVPRFHVFSKAFQPPVTSSPAELCDLFAAAGCDGVQWTVRPGGHCAPAEVSQKLPELVKTAASRGLACETICTAIPDGDDPVARRIAAVAADCGVRQLRTGYCFYNPQRESVRASLDRFRRVFASFERLGSSSGVKAVYQNHSSWGEPILGGVVWDVHEVIRDFDPRCVGVEYDPMHACYETTRSWSFGMELIAPWIASVDIKDFHYATDPKDPKRTVKKLVPAGEGVVPWGEVAATVRRCGIDPLYIPHFEYALDRRQLTESVRKEIASFRRLLT